MIVLVICKITAGDLIANHLRLFLCDIVLSGQHPHRPLNHHRRNMKLCF